MKNSKYTEDFDEEEDLENYSDIDDDQYMAMLRGIEPKKKKIQTHDFSLDNKYTGQKRNLPALEKDYEQGEDEELTLDDDDNVLEQDEIKKVKHQKTNKNNNENLPEFKTTKKKQNISKLSLQQELQNIQNEDDQIIEHKQQNTQELKDTALALQEQLRLWKILATSRTNLQKILENVKRLPSQNKNFIEQIDNPSLLNQISKTLLQNISALLETRQSLYDIGAQTTFDFPSIENAIILPDFEQVQEFCWTRCDQKKDDIQEDVLKWSQKSVLLQNIQKKQGLTGSLNFNSLISTPIGQTQKALQNKDKLIQKSRLKRQIFRILGQGVDDLATSVSKSIFDDTDFYLELLRETTLDQMDEGQTDMLTKTTQQYILQRQAQRQEKTNIDTDRRASKARKLRFDVHQKLINFMVPTDSFNEIEARDDIVANLFGSKINQITQKIQSQKSRKKQKLNKNDNDEEIKFL